MEQSQSPKRKITIGTDTTDADTLQCSIEDSGPGVAQMHMNRLFESFFTTKDNGIGMGVPICRSITDAHDGCIAC
ncbi:ATP-binding protein [Paraburkholderia sp. CNPSo 3274]|uniref:ATP-binding protein n=1 Tax=Paraburkholderia sp. CNPSo 3274 TaxID=2940932 RepID=UPI0020B711B9|nr:ATP-binding protein [Paraburkholderia sp. CNPSo 3274]MCP3711387.1 ATP-binding protein [Paraburkholderia sp. CNPSo 3274]